MTVFDPTPCALGEGALWHPLREQLFWFDILNRRLMTRENDQTRYWQFDRMVSAAGWVDHDTLLVATQTDLVRLDLATGAETHLAALEADRSDTRSNDGRADPWGGFWISTMGLDAQQGAGAIYRYYLGELRKLRAEVTIPNAICFAPDGQHAWFADTDRATIWRQPLGGDGWPQGEAEIWLDLMEEGLRPDGAVVDAEGCFWMAQWGAGRVARHAPDGSFLSALDFPASQTTCPGFGGPDFGTLFVTSATKDLSDDQLRAEPEAGHTFTRPAPARGLPEPAVKL